MKEIRRYWLAELLNGARFHGDRAAFCRDADITKGRLTQLLDPREAFGDLAAQKLADKLGLPDGYFSQPRPGAQSRLVIAQGMSTQAPVSEFSEQAREIARLFDAMPDRAKRNRAYVLCVNVMQDDKWPAEYAQPSIERPRKAG